MDQHLADISGKRFMDGDSVIEFAVSLAMLRNNLRDYQETYLSNFFSNPYTNMYDFILEAVERLLRDLRVEVASRSDQLGREERTHIIKNRLGEPPRKRRRRKTSKKKVLRKQAR